MSARQMKFTKEQRDAAKANDKALFSVSMESPSSSAEVVGEASPEVAEGMWSFAKLIKAGIAPHDAFHKSFVVAPVSCGQPSASSNGVPLPAQTSPVAAAAE